MRAALHGLGTTRTAWLMGAAFLQVWFAQVLAAVMRAGDAYGLSEMFYGSRGAAALAIALGCAAVRLPRSRSWMPLTWPVAMLMGAATLVLAWLPVSPGTLTVLVILCGAGLTWCCAQYAYLYSLFTEAYAMACILGWFAISAFVGVAFVGLELSVALTVVAVFPLAGTACLYGARRSMDLAALCGELSVGRNFAARKELLILTAELAVFGLVVGILRTFSLGIKDTFASSLVSSLLVLVLCAGLCAIGLARGRRLRLPVVYEGVLLGLVTVIVLVFLGQRVDPGLGVVSSWVMRVGLIMLLWLVLVTLAHRSAAHPLVVFGVGWGVYMLALMGGITLANRLDVLNQDASFFLCLAYLLVVSAVAAVGVARRREERLFGPSEAPVAPEATAAPDDGQRPRRSIDDACEEAAATYGLTDRELEVMRLICKGRSKRYIAEQLVLSENTVKFHAKQLYEKLGVHSRQELMSLAGIE